MSSCSKKRKEDSWLPSQAERRCFEVAEETNREQDVVISTRFVYMIMMLSSGQRRRRPTDGELHVIDGAANGTVRLQLQSTLTDPSVSIATESPGPLHAGPVQKADGSPRIHWIARVPAPEPLNNCHLPGRLPSLLES